MSDYVLRDDLRYFVDQYGKNLKIIREESDRGAVLVAASMFESALKELITSVLKEPSNHNTDPLFSDGLAPLGTFSARIEMAYRLGLLEKNEKELLNLFKKLRNEFAHKIEANSLNDLRFRDRINSIMAKEQGLKGPVEELVKLHISNSYKSNTTKFQSAIKDGEHIRPMFDQFFAFTIAILEAKSLNQTRLV